MKLQYTWIHTFFQFPAEVLSVPLANNINAHSSYCTIRCQFNSKIRQKKKKSLSNVCIIASKWLIESLGLWDWYHFGSYLHVITVTSSLRSLWHKAQGAPKTIANSHLRLIRAKWVIAHLFDMRWNSLPLSLLAILQINMRVLHYFTIS